MHLLDLIFTSVLNIQENWYIELHLDVLILWALAKTGELSKAGDLLEGLKSRLEESSSLCFNIFKCTLSISFLTEVLIF